MNCQRQRIVIEKARKQVYRKNTAACGAGWKFSRGVIVSTKGRLPGGPAWKLGLKG